MNKILTFTGGSTQGVGLSAIGCSIMEKYDPNIITGESVSAIFAIPLAMRNYDLIKSAMLSFDLKDIFGKHRPLNYKNNFPSFKGLYRIMAGKDSLGKQDELVKYIKKYITKELFSSYQSGDYAKVYVATFNANKEAITYFDLSSIDYENAMQVILASCNIPILINGIKIDDAYNYDAGITTAQSGYDYIIDNIENIDEVRSVWNRPAIKPKETYKPGNVINVTTKMLKSMIYSESIKSEKVIDQLCNLKKIKHTKYFFKTELDSLYDVDLIDRKIDWNNGLKIGKNEN